MNKKIIDTIFSTIDSNLNINFHFKYNKYDENESRVVDRKILTSSTYNKRYIKLKSTSDIQKINSKLDEYNSECASEIAVNNILKRLHKKNLNEQENNLFNKIYEYDKTKSVFHNKNDSNKTKIRNFYKINENDSILIDFLTENSQTSIDKESLESYSAQEINHLFPSNNELFVTSNYNLIKENRQSNQFRLLDSISSGNIFSNFNYFRLSDISFSEDITNYYSNCGFLVEKYKKTGLGYEKLSTIFINKNKSNDYFSLDLKDINIKYGETYLYTVSIVYLYRKTSYLDSSIVEFYLVCGYPFFTEDIVCIESEPPPPPVNIRAKYNFKESHLMIEWDEPSNYQEDIRGYQILKRGSLEEPYRVISEIVYNKISKGYNDIEQISESVVTLKNGDVHNHYKDKTFNPNNIEIYAIRSIDAHGNKSLYSMQVAFMYKFLEDETILDKVVEQNCPIMYPNLKLKRRSRFFENEDNFVTNLPVFAKKHNISLFFTPDFVNIGDNDLEKVICKGHYQFTLFKLNNQEKYEENIKVKNFNIF